MPASGLGCSAATQPRKRYRSSSRLLAPPGSSRSPGLSSSPSGPRRWMPRGLGAFFGRAGAPGLAPGFPAGTGAARKHPWPGPCPRRRRGPPWPPSPPTPSWAGRLLHRGRGLLRGSLGLRGYLLAGRLGGGFLHRLRFATLLTGHASASLKGGTSPDDSASPAGSGRSRSCRPRCVCLASPGTGRADGQYSMTSRHWSLRSSDVVGGSERVRRVPERADSRIQTIATRTLWIGGSESNRQSNVSPLSRPIQSWPVVVPK